MIVVERYASADQARRMAASLVERGVGATVEPASSDGEPAEQWAVTVMPDDRARARELLGLAGVPDDEPDEELARSVRSVLVPVLIGIVVLVTVPLIAFFVSYKLSGG